jgi:hypothetical protein
VSNDFNPHQLDAPTDFLVRIQDFARDLAYGVAAGLWENRFYIGQRSRLSEMGSSDYFGPVMLWAYGTNDPISEFLIKKWDMREPAFNLLKTMQYVEADGSLSEKAFNLLLTPQQPPKIFISYRRVQSSAFALLIEARLRLAGNPNPFLDKKLVPGEEWHARLEETIQNIDTFICVIGPDTLNSRYVLKEIEWAEQRGCRIIPVWHGITELPTDAPATLSTPHAIRVLEESALAYENAMTELLNALGYPTY